MSVFTNESCTSPTEFSELCGKTFDVSDGTRRHAVFDLQNTAVGVTVAGSDGGSVKVIFHPAVQIPVKLCKGFERFCFEHDDPLMVELNLDNRDGEVKLIKHVPARKDALEELIEEHLAFFDATACPAILTYISQRFAEEF